MQRLMRILSEKFERLGMPLDDQQLKRAAQISLLYSDTPEKLHDFALMWIAVEAHRRPEVDVPSWV
jgi:hypothetical protein